MRPLTSNPLYISFAVGAVFALSSCSQMATQPAPDFRAADLTVNNEISSVKTAIACLPEESALMAAHRGVSENWDLPENSASGLQRLIDENYLVAEVDVASTKDGTYGGVAGKDMVRVERSCNGNGGNKSRRSTREWRSIACK